VKVDAPKIKLLVERHLRPGPYSLPADELTFSERAKSVIETAREECVRAEHPQISPEHLLLGLLRIRNTVASAVLLAVDMDENVIRATIATHAKQSGG
jgi:ATP-dependent Clp protease ATP-binding subunit ClpA